MANLPRSFPSKEGCRDTIFFFLGSISNSDTVIGTVIVDKTEGVRSTDFLGVDF